MSRNAEVTRQWRLLREIEASRTGKTIDELAKTGDVCTRTIRRDLAALQDAGFSLCDDHDGEDGKVRWRLESRPFRGLSETSFNVAELAALYFSRTLLECSVEQPFRDDLKSAFDRLERAFSPRMRDFLSRLPRVLLAKDGKAGAARGKDGDVVTRLMNASLERHKAVINYHSFSSRRIKEYAIEPYRLVFANGSFYLMAYVPAYRQVRTFAVQRIKKLAVLDEVFNPVEQVPQDPFANSLGVSEGNPEHVEIEFAEQVAPYIKERAWHRSQKIAQQPNGSVLLSLDVCLDRALTSWILGFGPFARVVHPPTLAERILEEIEEARELYVPRLTFSADHAEAGLTADDADSRRLGLESTADDADTRRLGLELTADDADPRRLGSAPTAERADSRKLPFGRTADHADSKPTAHYADSRGGTAKGVLAFRRRKARRKPA